MQLKKTKLAGIISLLLSTTAMATTTELVVEQSDTSRFGPYVSAMDTVSGDTSSIITYTNTYAQPFNYDIGAPWTYNEYCVYDSEVCELYWDGSETDLSDGLYVWRRNILNTYNGYNGSYVPESTPTVSTEPASVSETVSGVHGTTQFGYKTSQGTVRSAFYDSVILAPAFIEKGGFSTAHDAADVNMTGNGFTFADTLVVGQGSVQWANADDSARFEYCFNYPIDDDRYDYDDLYYCPGFDLQASYWSASGGVASYLSDTKTTWLGGGGDALFAANAYAMNTSGFAVGFSTQQVYSSVSGGRSRATIFQPTVQSATELSYVMTEITKPKTDAGGDYNDIIRDTVAIDITDTVFDSTTVPASFKTADGSDNVAQSFIIVGNRTYAQSQNRSYATEFFTYDLNTQETRYPLQGNPVKGANSQVSKINNDGVAVGWRDARGETNPTYDGSPRFQSAFIYDYKTKKTAYLDDLYCQEQISAGAEITYRLSNAISISEPDGGGNVVVIANAYDYKTQANYTNRTGSTPMVVKMTISADEIANLSSTSQCPIKDTELHERSGAGTGWFILLPSLMLLFRRFSS